MRVPPGGLLLAAILSLPLQAPALGETPHHCFTDHAARLARLRTAPRPAPPTRRAGGTALGELAILQVADGDGIVSPAGTQGGLQLWEVDTRAAAARFYERFPDQFDTLVFWTDFHTPYLGGAYYDPVASSTLGIGAERFGAGESYDFSESYGSAGRLRGVVLMHDRWMCEFYRSRGEEGCTDEPPFREDFRSVHSVLLQEAGHEWLAFVGFRDPESGLESRENLGRQEAHWSYFLQTGGSPCEGNRWVDAGGGTFEVEPVSSTVFSPLDQYLMGLRPAEEVGPFFLIVNPIPGAPGSTAPESGPLSVTGRRLELGVDDIRAVHGDRSPAFAGAARSTREAWVLLSFEPEEQQGADAEVIERIRRHFNELWYRASDRRMRAITTLSGRDDLPAWEFQLSEEGWTGGRAEAGALEFLAGPEGIVEAPAVSLDPLLLRTARLSLSLQGGPEVELTLELVREDGTVSAYGFLARGDGAVRELVIDLREEPGFQDRGPATAIRLRVPAPAGVTEVRLERLSFDAVPPEDLDGDRIPDGADLCPTTPDPLQEDGNSDGVGDACQGGGGAGGGGAGGGGAGGGGAGGGGAAGAGGAGGDGVAGGGGTGDAGAPGGGPDGGGDPGCGCTGGSGAPVAALAVLPLVFLRRRRRSAR